MIKYAIRNPEKDVTAQDSWSFSSSGLLDVLSVIFCFTTCFMFISRASVETLILSVASCFVPGAFLSFLFYLLLFALPDFIKFFVQEALSHFVAASSENADTKFFTPEYLHGELSEMSDVNCLSVPRIDWADCVLHLILKYSRRRRQYSSSFASLFGPQVGFCFLAFFFFLFVFVFARTIQLVCFLCICSTDFPCFPSVLFYPKPCAKRTCVLDTVRYFINGAS